MPGVILKIELYLVGAATVILYFVPAVFLQKIPLLATEISRIPCC